MAYEFKKLSDVDIVAEPANEAYALIEENGSIKRVKKEKVGPLHEWDMIIEVSPNEIHAQDLSLSEFSIISGNVSDIVYKCQNLLPVNILFKWHWNYGEYSTTYTNSTATTVGTTVYSDGSTNLFVGTLLTGYHLFNSNFITLLINKDNEITSFYEYNINGTSSNE